MIVPSVHVLLFAAVPVIACFMLRNTARPVRDSNNAVFWLLPERLLQRRGKRRKAISITYRSSMSVPYSVIQTPLVS